MEISTLEAIKTLRSMRRLKPDPVEPEKVRTILEAAGKAPSGGNSQPWEFIMVKDHLLKQQLRNLAVKGLEVYVKSNLRIPKEAVAEFVDPGNPVAWLALNTDKVPVLILACLNTKRAKRAFR